MKVLEAAKILYIVFATLPVSWGIPFSIELCSSRNLPCQCGTPGFTFDLEIKQCPRISAGKGATWDAECIPCKDTDQYELCQQYRHCLDCRANVDGCVRCPARRYGRWCELECNCQNEGWCDEGGRCSCPAGFHGSQCEKDVECPIPFLNEHVIVHPDAGTYLFDSKIHFLCEEGFLLEGASEAKCLEGGRWSKLAPTCMPLCPALPLPEHGTASLPLGKIVPGTIVRFVCNQGFSLSGPSVRRCQEDGVWSRTQPECVPSVECPRPNITGNNIVWNSFSTSPFTPGSSISFRCPEHFVLVGKRTIKCDENGKWSQQAPVCVRADETCVSPGPLPNGVIKLADGVDEGQFYVKRTNILFSCNPLHLLFGSTHAACLGNGTWNVTLPTCEKVTTCNALDSLSNGFIHFLKPGSATHNARYFRLSGVPINMTRRTGLKDRFRTNLRPQSGVPQYRQEETLKMVLPEGFYHVGTQAMFDCESKYYKLHGSSMRTCLASGEWSGRPSTCVPLCGQSSDPRTPFITHGTPSDIGQWPWIVGISRLTVLGEHRLHCGASLIDERWAITAAHCVTYEFQITLLPLNELHFYAGKYFWNNSLDDNEVQVRKAESIIVHPDFDPFSFDSDIALIRLQQPVRLTSRVQPVCLPSTDPIESQERLKEGNRGVVIGWGETEEADSSDVLLHVQAPVVSTNTCVQGYRDSGINVHISSNMFCAGYEKGKHDACSGDSGGPFVFPTDTSATHFVLEGITSWGSPQGCGLEKQYSGYVRVQGFVDWIKNFV